MSSLTKHYAHVRLRGENGGLANRRPGMGPGARYGMSAKGSKVPSKAREMQLGDGSKVVVDIICRQCGFEQLHNYFRLRCQECQAPLKQVPHHWEARHSKKLSTTRVEEEAKSSLLSQSIVRFGNREGVSETSSKSTKRRDIVIPMAEEGTHHKRNYQIAALTARGYGGLALMQSGLGPGCRHGMSGKSVSTHAKTKELVLGNGGKIVIDTVCRRCGHEQPFDYHRLRCQSCEGVLRQISSAERDGVHAHVRGVGGSDHLWKYKIRRRMVSQDMQPTRTTKRVDPACTSSTKLLPDPRINVIQFEKTNCVKTDTNRKKSKRSPPSLGHMRSEAYERRGGYVVCLSTDCGKKYYFNTKTQTASWKCPWSENDEAVNMIPVPTKSKKKESVQLDYFFR